MQIYSATSKKIPTASALHDPNAILLYGFSYKPSVWEANTVYGTEITVVIPTVFNGFEYQVISNGISDAVTEPVWPTTVGDTIEDGSVTFKAAHYTKYLANSDTIVASTWSATDSVTVSSEAYTADGQTQALIGPVPAGVEEFTITNHITTSTGEEDDRSLLIKVKER